MQTPLAIIFSTNLDLVQARSHLGGKLGRTKGS